MKAHLNLNRNQKQAFDKEIHRLYLEWVQEHAFDIDKICLYILHKYWGFGTVRLKRFWRQLRTIEETMIELYGEDMATVPVDFLADISLNDIGVNVEQWDKELWYEQRSKGNANNR